jgi:hypothetical protein
MARLTILAYFLYHVFIFSLSCFVYLFDMSMLCSGKVAEHIRERLRGRREGGAMVDDGGQETLLRTHTVAHADTIERAMGRRYFLSIERMLPLTPRLSTLL